jgi:hypothetical protein
MLKPSPEGEGSPNPRIRTLEIKKTMATKDDAKLILSAIEILGGQMAALKHSLPSALAFARLEGRGDVIEKKLGLKS